MHNQYQPAVSHPEFRHTGPADFRVVARYTDRSQALVSMAATRRQAIYLAKQLVATVVRSCRNCREDGLGDYLHSGHQTVEDGRDRKYPTALRTLMLWRVSIRLP